jgi:transporter family protein
VLALGSAGFAALVAVFGKLGLQKVDPTLATTVRVVIMTAFFLVASMLTGKIGLPMDKKDLGWIVLSGLAGAMSWLCYFWAIKLGPVTGVAIIDRLSVVFVAILAALFLGEGFTWRTAVGVILASLGALVMIWK